MPPCIASTAKDNTPTPLVPPRRNLYDLQMSSHACGHCSTPLTASPLVVPCNASAGAGAVACPVRFCSRLCLARAARTHPDAPPHLPPLPFADHAEEMAGILYAPELLAPPPVIWLPNDVGGIGRSEAFDLQRYHNLPVTLDVRAKEDVQWQWPRRSTSSNNGTPHRIITP